jgi:hypothetical protein
MYPQAVLKRFYEHIPYRTDCGRNKKLEFILPKEKAAKLPYIRVNFPYLYYLVYDVDLPDAAYRSDYIDIPGPTLRVITKDTGHAHLLYELFDPPPRKPSAATKALIRDIIFAYNDMLLADRCITTQRQLVKNALSENWYVLTGYKPFTLSELAESIPSRLRQRDFSPPLRQPLTAKSFEETLDPASRNCSLFDNARFFAYATVNNHSTYQTLYESILDHIEVLNTTQIPKHFPREIQQTSELRTIARSIARWTFERRHSFRDINSGAMGFESMKGIYWEPEAYEEEVLRRRRLSAYRTHEIRKEVARKKVLAGFEACVERGVKPTISNVAKAARVSRHTVYKYMDVRSVHDGLSGKYTL